MLRWLYHLVFPADLAFRIPAPTRRTLPSPASLPPETRVRVDRRIGTLTGFELCDDARPRAKVVFVDPTHRSWVARVSLHRISLVPG